MSEWWPCSLAGTRSCDGSQRHGRLLRLSLAAVSLVLLGTGPGCERRDVAESASGDADALRARGESAVREIRPAAGPPIPAQAASPVPELVAAPSRSDSALVASPQELALLSGRLTVPVQGVERSQLRDTYDEARGSRVHEALDILAPRGTPVLSATDGRLLRLFDSRAGGLMVYATDATSRFILLYGHLDSYAEGLSEGMRLERGQVIGYVGTSGNAPEDTPHLHFGILRGNPHVSWSTGVPVNPYRLLRGT
jgi:peptidoglycan LD-endopeptidase LytH